MFFKRALTVSFVYSITTLAMMSLFPYHEGCSFIIFQACNAHGIYCVPLYDTLGKFFPGFTVFRILITWYINGSILLIYKETMSMRACMHALTCLNFF